MLFLALIFSMFSPAVQADTPALHFPIDGIPGASVTFKLGFESRFQTLRGPTPYWPVAVSIYSGNEWEYAKVRFKDLDGSLDEEQAIRTMSGYRPAILTLDRGYYEQALVSGDSSALGSRTVTLDIEINGPFSPNLGKRGTVTIKAADLLLAQAFPYDRQIWTLKEKGGSRGFQMVVFQPKSDSNADRMVYVPATDLAMSGWNMFSAYREQDGNVAYYYYDFNGSGPENPMTTLWMNADKSVARVSVGPDKAKKFVGEFEVSRQ